MAATFKLIDRRIIMKEYHAYFDYAKESTWVCLQHSSKFSKRWVYNYGRGDSGGPVACDSAYFAVNSMKQDEYAMAGPIAHTTFENAAEFRDNFMSWIDRFGTDKGDSVNHITDRIFVPTPEIYHDLSYNNPNLFGFISDLTNEISTRVEKQNTLAYRVIDLCNEYERLPGVTSDVNFTFTSAEKVRIMQTLNSLNEVCNNCESEQIALKNLCVKVSVFGNSLRAVHQRGVSMAEPRAQQTVAAMNCLDKVVDKFYNSIESNYPILRTKIDAIRREYLQYFTFAQWQADEEDGNVENRERMPLNPSDSHLNQSTRTAVGVLDCTQVATIRSIGVASETVGSRQPDGCCDCDLVCMMDTQQIAVDFQTESDVIRLHLTLFEGESDEEENQNDQESDGDERTDEDEGDEDDKDDYCVRPKKKVRRPSKGNAKKNAIIRIRGGLGSAAKTMTVIDTWHNLITESMLDQIALSTNRFIDLVRPEFARERDAAPTDSVEIKAFIGLLYMMGIHRGSRLIVRDFWDSSGIGIEMFRLTMPHKRFRFLMRCLLFDENGIGIDEDTNKPVETLNSIDQIFDEFVHNCQTSYLLGENVCVDVLLDTRRMPSTAFKIMNHYPAKHGLKILTLADSKILYTHSLKIFPDNETEELYSPTGNNLKIIEELSGPSKASNRHTINVDKRFSQFEKVFKGSDTNNRTVTFYDCKTISPISTLCKTYDVSMATRRWSVLIFFQMLNVAGINSQIIYTGNGNVVKNRRTFLRQLAIDLTKEHMIRRGNTAGGSNLPTSLHTRLLEVTNQTISVLPKPPAAVEPNKRKLCQPCLKDRSKKSTKYRCVTCGMHLCLGHVIVFCRGCSIAAEHAMNQVKCE
ncbi:hypothetical protein GE061_011054 [Apolygus lucorum]|uniref:PiggyBac transposable element-derived protein domain-containing protein n=1 Tax=Apolygus lucorum TaxID=248454 RepID=A0A8S9Y0F0_APOLU|nr:hypothetical protein GE061_011054 [Apolygus lucorum]